MRICTELTTASLSTELGNPRDLRLPKPAMSHQELNQLFGPVGAQRPMSHQE